MEPSEQNKIFEKFGQHDGTKFRKESLKFCFHYGTKVKVICTKFTERIFPKISPFTYLDSKDILKNFCEILTLATCENLLSLKK